MSERAKFNGDGTVTVSEKFYAELIDALKWKDALEAGGVDNWDFYHDSLEDHGYFDEDMISDENEGR